MHPFESTRLANSSLDSTNSSAVFSKHKVLRSESHTQSRNQGSTKRIPLNHIGGLHGLNLPCKSAGKETLRIDGAGWKDAWWAPCFVRRICSVTRRQIDCADENNDSASITETARPSPHKRTIKLDRRTTARIMETALPSPCSHRSAG
ncbi:uncharacterized protein ARMOST_15670 [Armillaria ostoyae]|uniref:Uncharacterized protein n=1 Tax=Armillaria ostoyae TaxID=47428 RepID=A0A284RU49_ARMOS|nr:uncharacterized protein ARMOST_15663 [Armillaria ostoyae]SJL12247.1 uncharacterized protein ARMOST_15670 [Armillaria ostoyae]